MGGKKKRLSSLVGRGSRWRGMVIIINVEFFECKIWEVVLYV